VGGGGEVKGVVAAANFSAGACRVCELARERFGGMVALCWSGLAEIRESRGLFIGGVAWLRG
jgi:hypothetical protein